MLATLSIRGTNSPAAIIKMELLMTVRNMTCHAYKKHMNQTTTRSEQSYIHNLFLETKQPLNDTM